MMAVNQASPRHCVPSHICGISVNLGFVCTHRRSFGAASSRGFQRVCVSQQEVARSLRNTHLGKVANMMGFWNYKRPRQAEREEAVTASLLSVAACLVSQAFSLNNRLCFFETDTYLSHMERKLLETFKCMHEPSHAIFFWQLCCR